MWEPPREPGEILADDHHQQIYHLPVGGPGTGAGTTRRSDRRTTSRIGWDAQAEVSGGRETLLLPLGGCRGATTVGCSSATPPLQECNHLRVSDDLTGCDVESPPSARSSGHREDVGGLQAAHCSGHAAEVAPEHLSDPAPGDERPAQPGVVVPDDQHDDRPVQGRQVGQEGHRIAGGVEEAGHGSPGREGGEDGGTPETAVSGQPGPLSGMPGRGPGRG